MSDRPGDDWFHAPVMFWAAVNRAAQGRRERSYWVEIWARPRTRRCDGSSGQGRMPLTAVRGVCSSRRHRGAAPHLRLAAKSLTSRSRARGAGIGSSGVGRPQSIREGIARGGRRGEARAVHPAGREGQGHRARPLHGRHGQTGMLHARFRVRRPRTRARPADRHEPRQGARRRLRRAHPGRRARRPHGGFVQDRRLFARTSCASRARSSRRSPPSPPRSPTRAVELVEVDYERAAPSSPTPSGRSRPGRPLIHAGWECLRGNEDVVRDGQRLLPLDDRQGRRRRRAGRGRRWSCKERYVADMSHAAPIEPHAVIAASGRATTSRSGRRPRCRSRRAARVAHTLQLPEARVRVIGRSSAAASAASASPTSRPTSPPSLARRGTPGEARLLASRGVRGPDHRREGMAIELETGVSP